MNLPLRLAELNVGCFVVECGHFAECSWDISWTNVALLANHNTENN